MGRKITTESFISEAMSVHGDCYGYDKTHYISYYDKVEIYCKKHKIYFMQNPYEHITNHGCPECGKDRKKITQESYIESCRKIHQNKYDYSQVEYKNIRTPIIIGCPIHGYFEQIAQGHKNGRGCPSCAKTGFDYNSDGYFYVQELIDENECVGYKFGITKNISKRIKAQKSKSTFIHKLIFSLCDSGTNVFKLEKLMKEQLPCNYLNKTLIPDGFTETISPNDILMLENIIIDFLTGENYE